MTVYRDIGRFIREKREHKHWTVAELAELSKMSVTALENIELGDSDPKLSSVLRISAALNINLGEIDVYTNDVLTYS